MDTTTERTATCSCGQFRVTTAGDPDFVNLCNCYDCQRRSGSAFHVAAFFPEDRIVATEGAHTRYVRPTETTRVINLEFCPTCGVSVMFRPDARPGKVGVHVGCYADHGFMPPNRILFAERAHPWVVFPPGAEIIKPGG